MVVLNLKKGFQLNVINRIQFLRNVVVTCSFKLQFLPLLAQL